ncbi:hypothetical protein H4R34_006029 [Dimargaris verticillata]|uniref:Uncharacterized protein n=1 Tax=Dimargaris verticillata TaxID=2761393 RepID=A0A9W8B2E5_9FUNG|nr:hypothetical protein H4R34_006029 [Dimargaris verticillata]
MVSTSSGQVPVKQASDPFDTFWDYVENLVDKISNPVAFATAPVGNTPAAARANDGSSPGTLNTTAEVAICAS